ncbi:DNA polymerase IV [Microbacterium sp. p3-SID336]|uniref:DNA polymerase IV n=1 Tax=Microbacterium sp. p3-SID336 TaxID=2916212 RepID=UPI0021A67A7B|nr:DNA polymerase IV [Microbacterium sp. p3-SID336]MCT1477413.1 DNA polymerase IV [Microbacterium sp. p3-SID336]
MRGEATVLHADLDAFYASVEQRDAPELRGRPVIVGGGVVLAASYEAKARGVRTAMGGRQARELCPDAVVVPPRMEAYSAASKDVFAIFRDTTPLVEGLSIDEAFLEVGGLRRIAGTPEEIAVRLRARVRQEVGLAISVGVARTKFLAKVASAVSKPDGLLVVEPEREEQFLLPLPVERLWGVGAVTAEKLHRYGVRTVGQLAELEAATAERMLGKATGAHVHALARLRDPRPVDTTRRRGSIGSQRALGSRPRTPEELDLILTQLLDRLARRLRDGDRVCRTVVLRLRFGDFTKATRSRTLGAPTDRTAILLTVARALLAAAQPDIAARGITLLGLSLTQLDRADRVQPELPIDWGDESRLDTVLDTLRDRYGATSVSRAAQLGRDPGWSTPILPEHE